MFITKALEQTNTHSRLSQGLKNQSDPRIRKKSPEVPVTASKERDSSAISRSCPVLCVSMCFVFVLYYLIDNLNQFDPA